MHRPIGLCSCGNQEIAKDDSKLVEKKSEIHWNVPVAGEDVEPSYFDIEKNDYHITSAIMLKDGTVKERLSGNHRKG